MPRSPNSSTQVRVVLRQFALRPEDWRHGYELCKLTGLRSGTLYPLLIRLDEAGLLEARWEPAQQAGRPPRHAYRLTAEGLASARRIETAGTDTALLRPAPQ